jgi:hypothetical protein
MGFTTSGEYKLKYEISGDNSKLKAAVAGQSKSNSASCSAARRPAACRKVRKRRRARSRISSRHSPAIADGCRIAGDQPRRGLRCHPRPGRSRRRRHRGHRRPPSVPVKRCLSSQKRRPSTANRSITHRSRPACTPRRCRRWSSRQNSRASGSTRSQAPYKNLHRRSARPPRVRTKPAR